MPYKPNSPGGRPVGLRNRVQMSFLHDAIKAWERDGAEALMMMAKEDPGGFVKVFAALLPKEVALEIDRPLKELTEEQLRAAIEAWKADAIDVTPEAPSPVKLIAKK